MEDQEKKMLSDDGDFTKTKESPKTAVYIFDTKEEPERQRWSNKVEFVLTCVGFSVGLGNVWRFPYLCYKNGGGAFLIPYFISLVCAGIPIFFLEVALGQFMSRGGWKVWKICPLFTGIGVANSVIVFLMNIYYIMVLTWAAYYFYVAMTYAGSGDVPWAHCNNTWNSDMCGRAPSYNCTMADGLLNKTCGAIKDEIKKQYVEPSVEFWEKRILRISSGIHDLGSVLPGPTICLLICWILCYACIWKGVKWTGKVVYFTALFPYVIITILLIRGATLDGALDGVIFYLKPDFSALTKGQVWIDAGTQIFFSYAIGLGALTALGSYNKFNNDCYSQCVLIAVINSGTSLFAGFAIFTILGFMAKQQGVPIEDVASSGPGLAFIAYPRAVAEMPLPHLWAGLFFIMIIVLGLDSQFVACEALVTTCVDLAPSLLKKSPKREIFMIIYFAFSFLLGITMTTNGGMYVFQLFDYYSASGFCLLWVCFFQVIAIAWVYGGRRFYGNIEVMIGYRINPWLLVCWTVLAPVVMAGVFIFSAVKFEVLTYNKYYKYPLWAQSLGILMAVASMIQVPVFIVVNLLKEKGSFMERLREATTPRLKISQLSSQETRGPKA
ncbi:sodium- and chloride-dependent taurine transporter-like [Lineus longissimus]|uniref:sodium- and chloride-dependent taurine transporter-like n=1 Tax=Lineus longissimus TaxID=88925 RepID=UPI002B4F4386